LNELWANKSIDPTTPRAKGKKIGSQVHNDDFDELPDPWFARLVYLFEDEVRHKVELPQYIVLILKYSMENQWPIFTGSSMVPRYS
jgi:hypothetical protein